jgi:hypothetical protein
MGTRGKDEQDHADQRVKQNGDEIRAFFANQPKARRLFDAVSALVDQVGPAERKVGKSEIAFQRKHGFAFCWRPDQYLHGGHGPLVLSIALRRHDNSKRWKEVVEPAPGRYMHHLELQDVKELDRTVRRWLQEAYDAAG